MIGVGPQEWLVLFGIFVVLYVFFKILTRGKKAKTAPSKTVSQQQTQQQSQQQSTSVNAPININIENVVKESTETAKDKAKSYGTCPRCDGKLSELIYYKVKAGESAECEFCGERISG